MYVSWRNIVGPCFLLACAGAMNARGAEAGVSYGRLEAGQFMRQWLVCGPFPVLEGQAESVEAAARREAFYRDYLSEHGGEGGIHPTVGMAHHFDGRDYAWQHVASESDGISLLEVYGPKEYVVAYAWAEFDIPEAGPGLLGLGSDDAVRVWLNGELVTENWTDRPVKVDEDLLFINFRAGKNQLLVKVQNHQEGWGFVCRLLDARMLGEKLVAAINNGEQGVAQMCLAYGADVNVKDEFGFTALHVARMRGQDAIVQQLLAAGADPNVAMPAAGTPVGFLDVLWDALKENYPMMEYAGAFDDSWYQACKAEIEGLSSLDDALPIMDRMLVRRLNDYHTNLSWGSRSFSVAPPILLALVEDQIVVAECPEGQGVARGDVLVTIDGAAARQRFDEALPTAFGATEYVKIATACREIIEGPVDSSVTLGLRNAAGQDYEVSLPRGGFAGGGADLSILSSRAISDNIGYIKIRGWRGFEPAEFDALLEPFRHKAALILDVRDNGGGADALAEEVIARFISKRVLCSVGFQRQAGTNTYEKIVFVTEPRGPWRYTGKVAVLINPGCASACEHFVSGMFEAGATLVGTPTTGACGWSRPINLPGGVTLYCSLTFPLHGKVPSPLSGIEPHRLVEPTIEDIRSGRDAVLEEAVALLSQ